MARSIREIALAFFFAMCGIAVLMCIIWLQPVIESQQLLIEETRKNHKEIMEDAEKIAEGSKELKDILIELGYAISVTTLKEEGLISHVEANKMIDGSVNKIESYSEKWGKLARIINEYRQLEEKQLPIVTKVLRHKDSKRYAAVIEYPDGRTERIWLSKIKKFKESGRTYVVTEDEEILFYDPDGYTGSEGSN